MRSIINIEGVGESNVGGVAYELEDNSFLVLDKKCEEVLCKVAYGFELYEEPIENGMIVLLNHRAHSENDVRCLTMAGTENPSKGWLCTVSALTSNQHDYFENPHFRKASCMAVRLLLSDHLASHMPILQSGSELQLSDFFDEEISIVVLYKPFLEDLVSENCNELLPFFYQYGFRPYLYEFSVDAEENSEAIALFEASRNSDLKLKLLSSEIEKTEFVAQVFRQLIPSAPTPLLKFFFYYQLIESLMAKVFVHRQSGIVEDMQPVKGDPMKLHPLIEKLKKGAAEKKRISLLFNQYSGVEGSMGELKNACNDFLVQCELEKEDSGPLALYQTRNIIFHNLERMPEGSVATLENISELTGIVVSELLINFRVPEAS